MGTTEKRLQEVQDLEKIWELPSDERPAPEPGRRSFDAERFVPGAWIAVMASIILFQPAPSDPHAAVPAWGLTLVTIFWAGLFATIFGLVGNRPWGMRASVATAGLGMAVAVACLATDHHTGAWWVYEMGAFTALGVLSLAALRRSA
jgi:hypothetical protein